jgi:urease accessory protein
MGTVLIVMARERPQQRDCGITAAALTPAALYRLMTWFSPGYPIGAFSYSSGIEWTVEAGDISDATMLRSWLTS